LATWRENAVLQELRTATKFARAGENVSALFLHADLPEESLIFECFHHAGVDEMIRIGFFCFRVLA